MGDLDQALLRQLVARAPDGWLVVDRAGRIVWSNVAFERLAGSSAGELCGQPLARVMPDAPPGGERRTLARADGSALAVQVAWEALGGDGEGLDFLIVRAVDERAQASARATERLLVHGALSAGILHELATPLNAVGFALDALGTDDAEARADALECARVGVEQLRRLFDDFRGAAVCEPRRRATDVAEIVDTALRLASPALMEADAEVALGFGTDAPVSAERVRLVQVLVNVLVNAAHAVEGRPEPRSVRIETRDEAPWVVIAVVDTGTGIAERDLPHVFEPYFTTKHDGRGTGLGLAIARSLVRGLGGEISLGAEPGAGTRVEVRLRALPR